MVQLDVDLLRPAVKGIFLTLLGEDWCRVAIKEDLKVKNKLQEHRKRVLLDEERAAYEKARPFMEEAERRFKAD